jgi:hypothetical protein
MARNAQLNLRVKPTLKAQLERLAKEDRRTLSAYVEKLLEDHVECASQVSVKKQKQKARGIFERLINKQAR